MNNTEDKIEYTYQHALEMLEQGESESAILKRYPEYRHELTEMFAALDAVKSHATAVRPSEALMQSALSKIPDTVHVKKSMQGRVRSYFFSFQAWSIASAAVLLIVGGVAFTRHNAPSSDTATTAANSNAALTQDMNTIDTQLDGLNSDNAIVDQALDHH
jgi:hypothetical protein